MKLKVMPFLDLTGQLSTFILISPVLFCLQHRNTLAGNFVMTYTEPIEDTHILDKGSELLGEGANIPFSLACSPSFAVDMLTMSFITISFYLVLMSPLYVCSYLVHVASCRVTGRGGYGIVVLGVHKHSEIKYAIKFINKDVSEKKKSRINRCVVCSVGEWRT